MWSTSHHHACRILHLDGLFGREQKQIGHWSWHELDRSSASEEQSEDFYPAEGCKGGWQASRMCVMETRCLTLVPRSPAFSTGRCLQMLRVHTIDILHWSQRSATPPHPDCLACRVLYMFRYQHIRTKCPVCHLRKGRCISLLYFTGRILATHGPDRGCPKRGRVTDSGHSYTSSSKRRIALSWPQAAVAFPFPGLVVLPFLVPLQSLGIAGCITLISSSAINPR